MKKIPDHIKAAALAAYHETDLTVNQIALKFGICPRLIYTWTKKEPRRFNDKTRISVRLTGTETEILIDALTTYNGSSPETAGTLRGKLETKLAEIKELENANK